MQQTEAENHGNVGRLTIKKCAICEFDKYQSSFQVIIGDTLVEYTICKSCRTKLNLERKATNAILNRISLL